MKLSRPSPFDAEPEAQLLAPDAAESPEIAPPSPEPPAAEAPPDAATHEGAPSKEIGEAPAVLDVAKSEVIERAKNELRRPIFWVPPEMARELVHEWGHYHGWMNNFVAAREMALNRIRERYEIKKDENGDYFATRKVGPFDRFLPRYAELERVRNPLPTNARNEDDGAPAPTSVDVAAARQRWDEAKKSGDPDRMTRAANDLLRAVEADRAESGEPTPAQAEGGRHPTSEVLAPEGAAKGGALSPEEAKAMAAEVGKMGAETTAAAADAIADPSLERFGVDMSKPGALGSAATEDSAEWLGDAGLLPGIGGGSSMDTASINTLGSELIGTRPFVENANALAEPWESATTSHSNIGRGSFASISEGRASEIGPRTNEDPQFQKLQHQRGPGRSDEYPEHPGEGLDRVRRAQRRGERRERRRNQRHWVDPKVGWSQQNANETLAAAAGKPLTVEALLVWSHEVYLDERNGVSPFQRIPPGWKSIAESYDRDSGYYAMAILDEATNTIVIINRGTEFTDDRDFAADGDIIAGRDTRQLLQAREFLARVWENESIRRRARGQPPKIIVTGHSLGSACAQMQIAAAYYDRRLSGADVRGVGFSSLGAGESIKAVHRADPRWRWRDPKGFDSFVRDRFVNYVRRGDGIVVDRENKGGRPAPLGDVAWLDAIDERGLAADEEALRSEPGYWSSEDPQTVKGAIALRVQARYLENHRMRSMYHPDFLDPLEVVLQRRRLSRQRYR